MKAAKKSMARFGDDEDEKVRMWTPEEKKRKLARLEKEEQARNRKRSDSDAIVVPKEGEK